MPSDFLKTHLSAERLIMAVIAFAVGGGAGTGLSAFAGEERIKKAIEDHPAIVRQATEIEHIKHDVQNVKNKVDDVQDDLNEVKGDVRAIREILERERP